MNVTPEQVSNFSIDLGRLYLMNTIINQEPSDELTGVIEEKLEQSEDIISVRFYTAMLSGNKELAKKALSMFEQQVKATEQIVLAGPKSPDGQQIYNNPTEGSVQQEDVIDDGVEIEQEDQGDIVDGNFTEGQSKATSFPYMYSDEAVADGNTDQEVVDSEESEESTEEVETVLITHNEGDESTSHFVIRENTPITRPGGIESVSGFLFSSVDSKESGCFIFTMGEDSRELQKDERNTFKLALSNPDIMMLDSQNGDESFPDGSFMDARNAIEKGYNFCIDIEIVATEHSNKLLMNPEVMIGRTTGDESQREILFSSDDLFMLGNALKGIKFVGFLTTEKP